MTVRRSRFVWTLPVIWISLCWLGFQQPGDEYGLWAVSSLAGMWVLGVLPVNVVETGPGPVMVGGGLAMLASGWLLDVLRARPWLIVLTWLVLACVLLWLAMGRYPSIERALAKNGSWQAYIYASANLGLTVTAAAWIAGLGIYRVVRGWPRWRRSSKRRAALRREADR